MDENKYHKILDGYKQETAHRAYQNVLANSDSNPDIAAKSRQLSKNIGIPQPAVEQDFEFYNKRQEHESIYDKLLERPISVQQWIAEHENARIVHDDINPLLYATDKLRSFAGAGVQFGSDVIGGTGDFAKDLGKVATSKESLDRAIDPSSKMQQLFAGMLLRAGGEVLDFSSEEGLDKAAKVIRPPEERQDFADDVIEGLGQVAAQIVLFVRNPAVGTGALFATGAEQQSDRLDANNVNDPNKRLLAQSLGGAVTAATERVQLGILLKRVPGMSKILQKAPKQLQNKWLDRVVDVGTAAGAEAAQETVEGFLQDAIALGIYNPDQEFFETFKEEAAVAGTVGAIARTGVLAVTGGRRANDFNEQAQEAEKLRQAAQEAKEAGQGTKLINRDPEKFKEFLSTANEGAEITLDSAVIDELYQSEQDIQKFFEAVPEAQSRFEEAELTGADVKLPADSLVFAMAQSADNGLDFIADFVKLESGITAREATDTDLVNERIEDILREAREEQAFFEAEQRDQELYEQIETQVRDNLMDANRLGEKARTPDAARQEAALYSAFAKTLIERGGKSARDTLQNVFGANFNIVGPQQPPPALPITGEDAYIDTLRKKVKQQNAALDKKTPVKDLLGKVTPKREKATPKPLINILVNAGKVKRGSPAAAELEAVGVSAKSYPRLFAKDGKIAALDNLVAEEVEATLGASGVFARDADLNGYIDPDQLVEFIREETFGNFIQNDEQVAQSQQEAYDDDVLNELDRRGVDITTADNDTIKRAMEEAANEYASGETLYQSNNISEQKVEDFKNRLIEKHDLKTLSMFLSRGDLRVDVIIVDKAKRNKGVGSKVMQEIVDFADQYQVRTTLTPAVQDDFQGTTSRSRLVKFYKKFGFVENKGRNKDFTISEGMYRDPKPQEFFQDTDGKRGSIKFGQQGERVITLFKDADQSTFFHETGHLFLDILSQVATDPDASQEIKDEFDAALKWLGVESADQITTEHHEKWARGFEAYIYEGKGPSETLRGSFDRFKIWLINVYKNIKALNVELNDDIRGVFDRLLATNEEIDALKNNQLFRPNEQTLEMLNEQQKKKYIKQQERAISEAKNKLFRKALRQAQRENTAWYKEQRDKIMAEEEARLQESNLYRAIQIVTTGKDFSGNAVFEGETKLSEKDVVDIYGNKEILKYLPRGSRTKGTGVDIKALAEMFGYKGQKDMLDAMINADPYKLRLQKNTDQEMIRRHGDMLNDGTIEREALEAVMSENPELNMVELEALSERTGTEYPSDGDFKVAARRALDQQIVDHSIKPDKYYRAALRAERDYGKLLAKEDYEGAADAKRRVILNKYMFKEARDARTEVEKTLKQFQKLSKQPAKKKKPVIDPEYHEKIWDALGAYQLGPRLTDAKRLKLELSAINQWIIDKEQDEFAQLMMPPEILAAQEKTHYRDLTLSEFRGLRDLVKNLETQGRRKLQFISETEKRDMADLIDELQQTAALNNSAIEKPLTKRDNEKLSARIGSLVGAIDAVNTKAQTIFAKLDGGDYGVWTRTFFEPIQAAEVQKVIRSRDEMQNLQDIVDKHYGKDYRRKSLRMKVDKKGDIVDVESYVQTFMNEEFIVTDGNIEENMTREMVLSIAMHQGTADNQVKLLDGYAKQRGWTQELIDDALSNMTKRDWEFVQDTWDYMDSFWPEVSKIEEREFGYAPEKIEHQPLTVNTADGEVVELRGGYMRIMYDRNQDVQSEKEAIADVTQQMMVGAHAKAQTKNGSTNERVNNVERPIRLDMDVVSEHINEQVTYITMYDAVKNANKVLRKQGIQEALQSYIGNEGRLMIETWLQDTAAGGVMAGGVINRGLRSLRGNYTLGRLGLRPMTAMLQLSGLAQTAGDVGTRNMLAGLAKVFSRGNPYAISNEIKAKSAFMKEREFTLTRDVADAVRNLTKPSNNPITQKAALMLYPMQKMQEVVDAVTWTANYQKYLKEGFDDSDAIRQADIAVSRTQGSGLVSDLAAIERGTLNEQTQRQEWVKLATMFFSYFNAKYNVLKNKNIQYRNNQIGLPDLAVSYMMTLMLEGLISALIMGQLDFDGDDDDNITGSEVASTIGILTLQQTAATIPFVRDIAGAASGFNAQGAAQAQLQGVGSFIGTIAKTGEKLADGDDVNWYAFWRGATNTVNAVLPIPAGAINQVLRGAEKEMEDGDASIVDYMVYRED